MSSLHLFLYVAHYEVLAIIIEPILYLAKQHDQSDDINQGMYHLLNFMYSMTLANTQSSFIKLASHSTARMS